MNRGAETAGEHQPQIRRECSGCECDTAGDVTASVYRPAMPSRVVSASAPLCAFAATRAAVQPRSRGARHPGWARYRCVFDQARGARRCSGRTSDRWGYVSSPCSIATARVTSPARSRAMHTSQGWCTVRQARPPAMWAQRTLTVCDTAKSGQAVMACSRCEQSPEARQRAVCGVVAKRKRSVDVNQCV